MSKDACTTLGSANTIMHDMRKPASTTLGSPKPAKRQPLKGHDTGARLTENEHNQNVLGCDRLALINET